MSVRITEAAVLDTAQEMVQFRGFNAFSYADLAVSIGIKTSSIHYYFPTKADLGQALMVRYRQRFNAALLDIDKRSSDPRKKLERYARLFQSTLEDGNRMCLCGMLASDLTTLPPEMVDELRGFFEDNERWLAGVLAGGRATGAIRFEGPAAAEAHLLVSTLEGAMLISRLYGNAEKFKKTYRIAIRRLFL